MQQTFLAEKALHFEGLQKSILLLQQKVTDFSQLTAWRVKTVTKLGKQISESAQPQRAGQVYLPPAYKAFISATQLEQTKYQLANHLKATMNDILQALDR